MNISIKKNILGGIFFIAMLFLASCQKDEGATSYEDAEVIQITGLSTTYTAISNKDVIKISLSASSNIPNADFDYVWAVYETNNVGITPKLDTISRSKDLVYPVTLPAKGYRLVSIVTNKTTGLSKYSDAQLAVVTEYTRGWYVLKDDGKDADLDQFLTPTGIVPTDKNNNIYSKINGHKVEGIGTRLAYLSDYKSTQASATPANTKTLFLGTEKDMAAIFINTLEKYRDRNSLFFGTKEGAKDMVVFSGASTQYLMNNGHLHGIYSMAPNSGIFGGYFMRDENNSAYELSPYFLTGQFFSPLLFDNKNSSFLTAVMAPTVFSNVTDKNETQLSAQNNNQKLLYMAYQNDVYDASTFTSRMKGWALFEDKSTAKKTLAYLEPDGTTLFATTYPIEPIQKLNNSSKHSILVKAENMLYFVYNNRDVYTYNLSNGNEQLQYSVPGNEEVTFIRHRTYTEKNYAFNYVIIGTKVGSKYKIRMFEKTSGNLNLQPVFVLEGDGIPRDVMYISPTTSSDTFPPGY